MPIIEISSKPIIEKEKKQDSFDELLRYNRELRQENSRLSQKLALIEHEIERLLPAAHFLRSRDALHKQLSKYATLAETCRNYRMNPTKDRLNNILAALQAVESEEKM